MESDTCAVNPSKTSNSIKYTCRDVPESGEGVEEEAEEDGEVLGAADKKVFVIGTAAFAIAVASLYLA